MYISKVIGFFGITCPTNWPVAVAVVLPSVPPPTVCAVKAVPLTKHVTLLKSTNELNSDGFTVKLTVIGFGCNVIVY